MKRISYFYLDNNIFSLEDISWIRMSPSRRLVESGKLWNYYKAMGGKFDFSANIQSPIRPKKRKLKIYKPRPVPFTLVFNK